MTSNNNNDNNHNHNHNPNCVEKSYEGIKIEDGKEVVYTITYQFYQAKYREVLEIENITDFKARNLALKKLCIKKSDGSNLTDQEILDMPAHEATWLEIEMLKTRCVEFPFGNLSKLALEMVTEADTIISKHPGKDSKREKIPTK